MKPQTHKLKTIAFNAQYSMVAVGDLTTGNIHIYHVPTNTCTAVLSHSGAVTGLDFNDAGYHLVSAAYDREEEYSSIRLWDIHPVQTSNSDYLIALKTVFVGAPDSVSRPSDQFNLASSTWKYSAHHSPVTCIKFAPEPQNVVGGVFRTMVVSGDQQGTIKVWDYSSTNCIEIQTSELHRSAICSLEYSGDGVCLFTCSRNQIIVYKIVTVSHERIKSRDSGQSYFISPIYQNTSENFCSIHPLACSIPLQYHMIIVSENSIAIGSLIVSTYSIDGDTADPTESWYKDVLENKEYKGKTYPDPGLDYAFSVEFSEQYSAPASIQFMKTRSSIVANRQWEWLPTNRFDNSLIVAISGDDYGKLTLWVADNYERFYQHSLSSADELSTHLEPITDICFLDSSSDTNLSSLAVTASADDSMIIWDLSKLGSDQCFVRRIERDLCLFHQKQFQELKRKNTQLKEELASLQQQQTQ